MKNVHLKGPVLWAKGPRVCGTSSVHAPVTTGARACLGVNWGALREENVPPQSPDLGLSVGLWISLFREEVRAPSMDHQT